MAKRVLVPVSAGFEELEAVAVIDLLRRGGLEVVVAGLGPSPIVGRSCLALTPDTTLDAALAGDGFAAVVLPGGQPNADTLAADPRIRAVLRTTFDEGGLVAAICAAPLALHAAGLVTGRALTSHPSVQDRLTGCDYREAAVVVDGRLVTSRGPGTAVAFALALITLLVDAPTATSIARTILAEG